MSKKMCRLVKHDLEKEALKTFIKQIHPCKFVCKKCGLVSNSDDTLCKGKKIKDVIE